MRHAIILTAAAIVVAACAAPHANVRPSERPIGSVDPQGLHASVTPGIAPWALYRQFNFDSTSVDISTSDLPKLTEIVAFIDGNSSLDVGIDGTLGPAEANQAERDLSDDRAASVRLALMGSGGGVASYKIQMGPFADPKHRQAGQIQVLVRQRVGSITAAR